MAVCRKHSPAQAPTSKSDNVHRLPHTSRGRMLWFPTGIVTRPPDVWSGTEKPHQPAVQAEVAVCATLVTVFRKKPPFSLDNVECLELLGWCHSALGEQMTALAACTPESGRIVIHQEPVISPLPRHMNEPLLINDRFPKAAEPLSTRNRPFGPLPHLLNERPFTRIAPR